MTWSPGHCLEELLQPEAVVARDGRVAWLAHAPLDVVYRARCGDRHVDGFVVPHEEVLTLASRFPGIELAFVYRLPPAALAAAPGRTPAGDWRVHRMYPPHCGRLRGRDRVGVLLCSLRFGELWILLHREGAHVPGIVDRRSGACAIAPEAARRASFDIIDALCDLTLSRGGQIVEVHPSRMPSDSPIAAVSWS